MDLRLLRTFVAVAELRHFARAAERCNLSQPAVSHQVRQLEEQAGARLLNRDARQVSLTVAGEVLLEDARRILAAVDRARERVHGVSSGIRGRIRLGATETTAFYWLPGLLARYRAAHPRYDLELQVDEPGRILDRVAGNELDMAVVAGRSSFGELRSHVIGSDTLVLVAPAGSPLAAKTRLRPADLRDERWIAREEGSDTRRQTDRWMRRHRLKPTAILTLRGPAAVSAAVIAGLGVSLVSSLTVEHDLKAGRLKRLRLPGEVPSRPVLLVDHPHKHHGAACEAMIGLLRSG